MTLIALCAAPALAQVAASQGSHAVVRVLDRVSGDLHDLDIPVGETAREGGITVALSECRYPSDNPSSDAYAHLDISDSRDGNALFSGWMLASSPGLNGLDHPRYDVWLMRCLNK